MNEMSPITDLVPAAEQALVPAEVFSPGGVRALLDKMSAEAREQAKVLDVSTTKGRAAIKSLVHKVTRSKTALDDMGKGLTDEWRERTNAVNAERRVIRAELEALAEEVRQPLTDFENAEIKRVEAHELALLEMQKAASFAVDEPPVEEIDARLTRLGEVFQRDWQEFGKRATDTADASRAELQRIRARVIQLAAEREELARLRAEQEERARQEAARLQAEREAQIAAEAAERAKAVAEQEAERRRREEAARVERERQAAEESRLAEKRRAQEAEERAAQAERDRVAAIEKAEADRIAREEADRRAEKEAYVRSLIQHIIDCGMGFIGGQPQPYGVLLRELDEKVSITAEEYGDLEGEAREALATARQRIQHGMEQARRREEDARRREEEAAERERRRAAEAKAAEEAEAARRAANKAHKAKINGEVLLALVSNMGGFSVGSPDEAQELGKAIVRAIASGAVPHTSIAY